MIVLFLGVGQIGKAILDKVMDMRPDTVIIHNLTENESNKIFDDYHRIFPETKFVTSHGDIFLPDQFSTVADIYESKEIKDALIQYYYSEQTETILQNSSIYSLIKKWKPDLVIDAINTGTVLGNKYHLKFENSFNDIGSTDYESKYKSILLNDFVPKIINFVLSLKLAMEEYGVCRYVKVSTTGLGGMGLNMPYTHGDASQEVLSYALLGKISASGILHQMLWNLSHIPYLNISLVIPATFVGYDHIGNTHINNSNGFIYKINKINKIKIEIGKEFPNSFTEASEPLIFPVIKAGENHVYSLDELITLTSVGQMEAVTKEEVAQAAVDIINGNGKRDILNFLDAGMIKSSYAGRVMVENSIKEIRRVLKNSKTGIATCNLGVTVSKHLYELFFIKEVEKSIVNIINHSAETIYEKIISYITLNEEIVKEPLSLGIPILLECGELIAGTFNVRNYCDRNFTDLATEKSVNKLADVALIDLRKDNIVRWKSIIKNIYEEIENKNIPTDYDRGDIIDDFNIGSVLAFYYSFRNSAPK